MKVIKDAMMKWLDQQIAAIAVLPTTTAENMTRMDTLLEVEEKLQQIITEEFAKLEHPDA